VVEERLFEREEEEACEKKELLWRQELKSRRTSASLERPFLGGRRAWELASKQHEMPVRSEEDGSRQLESFEKKSRGREAHARVRS